MKVLLIDDDQSVRNALRMCFEALGVEVIVAESGERAVAVFGSDREIEFVICDFNMPGMDGLETAMALMSIRPIRVVIMSGNAFDITTEDKEVAGVEQVLQKPIGFEQLEELIRA